jgi:hypothetical protein
VCEKISCQEIFSHTSTLADEPTPIDVGKQTQNNGNHKAI